MNKVIIVAAYLGAEVARAAARMNAEVITPEEAESRGLKPMPQLNIPAELPAFNMSELGRAPHARQPQYQGYTNSRRRIK